MAFGPRPSLRALMLALALWSVPSVAAAAPTGSTSARAGEPGRAVIRETVALAPRDAAALAAYATAVADPASPLYRHFLTVAEFARRFGPTAAQIDRVRRVLAAHGLRAGALSANHLELAASGTVGDSSAFSAALVRRGGGASGGPALSGLTGGLVQGLIGPGAPAPTASVVFGRSRAGAAPRPRVAVPAVAAGPQACSGASQAAADGGAYTAGQIAAAYGLSGYWAAGDEGQGITIALYELEPFSASDVAAYQACYGTSANVTVVPVDGGAGSGAGSGEAAMDVEDLAGLAPRATIRVYEAPPNGAGAFDAYSRMISDDSAQVISTSWGLCEALQGAGSASAENTLFQEAAAQGQTVVAASGDQGSDDCGSGQPAVDDPASQPYVTGVGATTLQPSGNTVWSNSLGATGGGVSQLWGLPAYQAAFAQPQSSVSCGASGTSCREVPDLSLDGDPETGYVAYWQGAWRLVGGTSVAAPTVAALTALADASPACGGRPIGFLNPALYRAAASGYTSSFADVTTGTNSFDGVAGFAAGPGYDMASGLGTPGATLGEALCTGAATVAPPGQGSGGGSSAGSGGHGPTAVKASQPITISTPHIGLGHVGVRARLRLQARDARRLPISWSALGLPRGLRIDRRTGVISGVPAVARDGLVRVRASDSRGDSASVAFGWTVAGRPSVLARLVPGGGGRPAALALRVLAGRYAPGLRRLRISIAGGGGAVRFAPAPARTPLQALAARWTGGSKELTIALASAWREVSLGAARSTPSTLSLPAAPLLVGGRGAGAFRRLTLSVTATDASGFRTALRLIR